MIVGRLVSFLALALGALGQDVASECPAPNGFFADARQCDKYYQCIDNVLTEKMCPDGMAFNDINPALEKCDLLALVDCTDRPQLQPPNPTEFCKRQNGNFAPPDVPNCAQAYRCVEGISTLITCPDGLAFSLENGICDWPDQTDRTCDTKKNETFECPKEKLSVAVSHPRYADPADCQYFYVCINGAIPRRNGCSFGQVFSTNTSTCTVPTEVPECADYYTEYFDEYFESVKRNPAKLETSIIAAATAAGYNVPKFQDKVRIQPGARRPSVGSSEPRGTPRPSPSSDRSSTRLNRPGSSRPQSQSGTESATTRPRRRRPGQGGLRRRRPKTTTTTTTTTPPPDYYYYYDDDYYYDDPPPDNAVPENGGDTTPAASGQDSVITAAAPPSPTSSPTRSSVPIRPLPLIRSST